MIKLVDRQTAKRERQRERESNRKAKKNVTSSEPAFQDKFASDSNDIDIEQSISM